MQALQPCPVTLRRMVRVLWRQRWTCLGAGVASVLVYHLLLLLVLSAGFTEPPTYIKMYNLPQNILTIWRSTPSLTDVVQLVDNEPVLEFGRTSPLFKAGKIVTWNYVATVHVIGDTGLVFMMLAVYVTVLRALRVQARRQSPAACPGLGRVLLSASVLSLIGAGTGAVCCGAISLSLVATLLGATATTVAMVAQYQWPVILAGYLFLGGSLVYQIYRLYHLMRARSGKSTPHLSPLLLG